MLIARREPATSDSCRRRTRLLCRTRVLRPTFAGRRSDHCPYPPSADTSVDVAPFFVIATHVVKDILINRESRVAESCSSCCEVVNFIDASLRERRMPTGGRLRPTDLTGNRKQSDKEVQRGRDAHRHVIAPCPPRPSFGCVGGRSQPSPLVATPNNTIPAVALLTSALPAIGLLGVVTRVDATSEVAASEVPAQNMI